MPLPHFAGSVAQWGEARGVEKFRVQLWAGDEIHYGYRLRRRFSPRSGKDRRGRGLTRMEQRARLGNGTCSVDSRPEKGTTVHARGAFSFGKRLPVCGWLIAPRNCRRFTGKKRRSALHRFFRRCGLRVHAESCSIHIRTKYPLRASGLSRPTGVRLEPPHPPSRAPTR